MTDQRVSNLVATGAIPKYGVAPAPLAILPAGLCRLGRKSAGPLLMAPTRHVQLAP